MKKIINKFSENNINYTFYDDGTVKCIFTKYLTKEDIILNLPLTFANMDYTVKVSSFNQNKIFKKYLTKNAKVENIYSDFSESFVCPVNKTSFTLGYPSPKTVSFKGPTKMVTVENVSSDSTVGVVTSTVNEVILNLSINQFITLKIDINGAKINNLPEGFSFINNEICGAAKNPGEYKCNIISEAVSIPVKFIVKNIIRIA